MRKSAIPFIATEESVMFYVKGKPYACDSTNPNFKELISRLFSNSIEEDEAVALVDKGEYLKRISDNQIEIVNGEVLCNGERVEGFLVDRILAFSNQGFMVDNLLAFLKNVKGNPSPSSVQELYQFLEKNNLPITEDGCFLAYKRIRDDYKDVHSGTYDNHVGCVVSMPRLQVDSNRNETCSRGLHVCSWDYLGFFGGERVIIVKVNPKDVVSVPVDYNNAKMRVCSYEVVSEMEDYVNSRITSNFISSSDSMVDDDWDEDDDEDDPWDDDDIWDEEDYEGYGDDEEDEDVFLHSYPRVEEVHPINDVYNMDNIAQDYIESFSVEHFTDFLDCSIRIDSVNTEFVQVGSLVSWTSQANGHSSTKKGIVLSIDCTGKKVIEIFEDFLKKNPNFDYVSGQRINNPVISNIMKAVTLLDPPAHKLDDRALVYVFEVDHEVRRLPILYCTPIKRLLSVE